MIIFCSLESSSIFWSQAFAPFILRQGGFLSLPFLAPLALLLVLRLLWGNLPCPVPSLAHTYLLSHQIPRGVLVCLSALLTLSPSGYELGEEGT